MQYSILDKTAKFFNDDNKSSARDINHSYVVDAVGCVALQCFGQRSLCSLMIIRGQGYAFVDIVADVDSVCRAVLPTC